jgi:hypothetical protein
VQVVATRHNVELVRYLITQGARLDTTEHTNALSPIHIAAVRGLTRHSKTRREHSIRMETKPQLRMRMRRRLRSLGSRRLSAWRRRLRG